jgi:hypothetical protein
MKWRNMRSLMLVFTAILLSFCCGFSCGTQSDYPLEGKKQIADEASLSAYLPEGMRLSGYEETGEKNVWCIQMAGEKRIWQLVNLYLDKPKKEGVPITGVVFFSNRPLENQKALGNKGVYFTWDEKTGSWSPAKPAVLVNQ